MVAQVGALRVTVGADITGLQTGMMRAQRQVAQSAGAMKRSVGDLQLTFKELATFSSRAFRVTALAFAGTFGARALLNVADAAKNLTAQLKLATAEYGSFAQAQKDVRDIAEASRSGLTDIATLYATLQRSSGELGNTQEQTARITETVAKSLVISGSSAQASAQAVRQLIQAFQSGIIRGDEFNTMMEAAPRLAKLLAAGLSGVGKDAVVTTGDLRKMAEAGELTADKLVKSFTDKKFTAAIDAEFKQLPVTFDQAMTLVYNAAVIVFGEFDSGGQFSTALANFITGGTQGFADLAGSAYQFGAQTRGVLDGLDAVRAGIASLHTEGISGLLDLNDATITLRGTLETLLGVVDGVANAFVNLFQAPANIGRLISGSPLVLGSSNLAGSFGTAYDKAQTEAQRRKIMGRSAADVLAEFGLSRKPPPFRPPAGKKKSKKDKAAPRDRSNEVEYQFENEIRQAQRDILQAQQELARTDDDRTDIALALLDLDKQQQNAELDERVRKAERDFAEKKITAGALAQVTAQAQILRAKYDEADGLKRRAVIEERAHKQYEDDVHLNDVELDLKQDTLRDQLDLAKTASERRDIELRLLDLAQRQERARLEAVLADEQSSVAAKDEAQMRLRSLDDRFAAQRQGVIDSTRNPLEAWAASVPQTAKEITEALQGIEANALDGIADAITDIIDGTKSMAEAFGDMARSIISDIIRMTVRMLIFQAISGIFKGSGFTGGGATATSGAIDIGTYGGPRAAGGPVVPGRTYMVGEKGPELVRFGASGQVIPNHAIGGGGPAVIVNQHNNFAGGAVTRDDLVRMHTVTVAAAERAVVERGRRAG